MERYSVSEYARLLGITRNAILGRIKRKSITFEMHNGRYVILDEVVATQRQDEIKRLKEIIEQKNEIIEAKNEALKAKDEELQRLRDFYNNLKAIYNQNKPNTNLESA